MAIKILNNPQIPNTWWPSMASLQILPSDLFLKIVCEILPRTYSPLDPDLEERSEKHFTLLSVFANLFSLKMQEMPPYYWTSPQSPFYNKSWISSSLQCYPNIPYKTLKALSEKKIQGQSNLLFQGQIYQLLQGITGQKTPQRFSSPAFPSNCKAGQRLEKKPII